MFLLFFQSKALAKLSDAEFIKYCETGSYENIERMIKEGADVNVSSGFEDAKNYHLTLGATPLRMAVRKNPDENVAKLLIKNGAFVNHRITDSSSSILNEAVFCKRSFELIKFLVENGADVNINTAMTLHYAMYHPNSAELIQYLISKGVDVNAISSPYGPPLLEAVRAGSLEIVKILINNGADIHYKHIGGSSILAAALDRQMYKGDTAYTASEIVDFLIKNGANIYDTNDKGETIVEQAAWNITPASLDVLVRNNYKFKDSLEKTWEPKELDKILLTAVYTNPNPKTIQKLIDLGADVNIHVIIGTDVTILKKLRIIDKNSPNIEYSWETPLKNRACYWFDYSKPEEISVALETIKVLLKNGASILVIDSDDKMVSIIDLVEVEYSKAKEKAAQPLQGTYSHIISRQRETRVQYFSEVLKILKEYPNIN